MADGASPTTPHFDAKLAQRSPLSAFALLAGGDAFEVMHGRPPPDGARRAAAYVDTRVRMHAHGASAARQLKVREDIIRMLSGNGELVARMQSARPLDLELIPKGKSLSSYGFPKGSSATAIGLFWDNPQWDRARIALREDQLDEVPQLTAHEFAHAIHFLGFTTEERALVHRALVRTFLSRAGVDEAFAIYSEREFISAFTEEDKRAPHVYGFARTRWSEDHVFTRFVRHLYFPYRPLAGPKMGG